MGSNQKSSLHGQRDSRYAPEKGEKVWMNYPDHDEPLGVVVGFVSDEVEHRRGQPIIEAIADETGRYGRKKKGDRFVIHPMFLLPFPHGGEEWKRADAEGRIG